MNLYVTLTIILAVIKLTGLYALSWLQVFTPFFLGVFLTLIFFAIAVTVALLKGGSNGKK